jgi:hypothetical protein
VAYFKGHVRGRALLESLPFDDLRLTAHVDTGKEKTNDVLRQLIDPDKYYPVYGDMAHEVQDVKSRGGDFKSALGAMGKLYIKLEADDSKLTVGSFKSELKGIELFRYTRTQWGASLDLDETWTEGQHTEAHAFVATAQSGMRHRQLLLQATGGSFYFLRDGDLYEGSEQVRLVVRDAITGVRLAEVAQARDTDYHIDYRQGRLTFSKPLPSTVTDGWHLGNNNLRMLQGHAVFIEVDYDYDATNADSEQGAFGLQARHTLELKHQLPFLPHTLTFGAGVVDEDKSSEGGPHYRLIGVEARAKLATKTSLDLELAFSQAQDATHFASFDGGISYGNLGLPEQTQAGAHGGEVPLGVQGLAGKLQLAGELGEFVILPFGPADPDKPVVPFSLYAQHQDPGFYAGSSIMEQGQSKLGGQVRVLLNDRDSVRLRHDSVWSFLALQNEDREVVRQLTTVGYEHERETWLAGAEFGHSYNHDGQNAYHTGRLALYGEYTIINGLVALAEQEVILFGGDTLRQGIGAQISSASLPSGVSSSGGLRPEDRFATTVGLRYELTETLWIVATESLRYNGTNATQLGVRTHLSDDLSFYATERLTAGQNTKPVATTVIGAESTAIPGSRSYAEYQLDTLMPGKSGRAVLGMDNEWVIEQGFFTGLTLSLSYERTQLVGTTPLLANAGSSINVGNTTGFGSGTLAADQQFSASGYSSSAVFPVGVSSRDAFAVGAEYHGHPAFKTSLKLELRYDRADDSLALALKSTAADRLMLFGQAAADARLSHFLVALARVRGAMVKNVDLDFDEGQYLDLSLGLALRPADSDRFGALSKWTRRLERTAVRSDMTQYQLTVTDVVSVEPYFEIGWGFQFVGKFALKVQELFDAELRPDGVSNQIGSTLILGLGRINYHVTDSFDAGVEYRVLTNMLAGQTEHGALVELAWIIARYVSIGVGYNFTHFSDDLLVPQSDAHHGLFLRATGRY